MTINQAHDLTEFWGASFVSEDIASASERIISLATTRTPIPVRLMNAYSVAAADKDCKYREVVKSHGINYADGMPLAAALSLVSWTKRTRRHSRVRGPSLFEETLRRSENSSVSHLFFGSSESTMAELRLAIKNGFPNLNATAFIAPPIAEPDELAHLARLAHDEFGGDIVWLGLGTPKQDIVAHLLAPEISRPCIGVGAAFDFLAGSTSSAPLWMQRSGTEWLHRLMSEPRRLWRRYTIGNLHFLKVVLCALATTMILSARNSKTRGHQNGSDS